MSPQRKHNVIDLPRAVYTGTDEPLTIRDPIYPRASEVHVGSRFGFYGHSVEKPEIWIVEQIINESRDEWGAVRHSLAHVKRIGDRLLLRNDRTRETVWRRFVYLSTSAAWRLES